jgi:CelD/BcsL family acetyltransferase involved in cellulose biosynthesis
LEIDVLRPQDLSPSQVDRWSALQAPGLDSPFLSPHWARAVERTQALGVQQTRVAVLRRDGRDAGFFAARVGAFTAMPAGAPMCDYQGVVAEPDLAVDPKALVQALGVHRLDYSHMLQEQAAFAAYAQGRTVSHVVDVSQGFAAYQEARKAAGVGVLKDAAKKRRKVEREVGAARFTAFSRARCDFDQLVAWKRAQLRATDQTDIFEAGWTLRLLRELFESRDPDFGGVLFTLHLGDRLAAAHFHLHGGRVIHGWMIAHDPEFERYSPGIALFVDILEWMDQTPYSRLDLGPGDYRFKTELANTAQGVTHGFVGLPSAAALVRTAAYGVVRAAEALPLGRVSGLPGKALRRMDQWRGLR